MALPYLCESRRFRSTTTSPHANLARASQRIAHDCPTHRPSLGRLLGTAALPQMQLNNELFISRTTTQRALSDDCTLARVYAFRLRIERKKANDYWPFCNAFNAPLCKRNRGGGTSWYIILTVRSTCVKQFLSKSVIKRDIFTNTAARRRDATL